MPRSQLGVRDVRTVPVFIYGLCEPNSGEVRYVGRTADLKARLTNHRSAYASRRVREWLSELAVAGQLPTASILHTVEPGDDADRWERHFINEHRGDRLLNAIYAVRRPLPAFMYGLTDGGGI